MNFLKKTKRSRSLFIKTVVVFILFVNCLCGLNAYAQSGSNDIRDSLKKTVVRLNFISPGFSVEREISFSNTIIADVNLYVLPIYDTLQFQYYIYYYPRVKCEFRHYYNFVRRLKEGKNINRFSGSYIGVVYERLFGDKREPTFDQFGLMWGSQYVSEKRFHIGFNIGFGYFIYEDPRKYSEFNFLGDLKIGYSF